MKTRGMQSTAVTATFLTAVQLVAITAASDRTAYAQATCNGLLSIRYVSAPPFALPGDTVRVSLALGAASIAGGTKLSIHRVRFELDCAASTVPCPDLGGVVEYEGDSSITSDCNNALGDPVSWSSGHDAGAAPNEVVFSPSDSIEIPAGTPAGACSLEFDTRVLALNGPFIQQIAWYDVMSDDAECDNGLSPGSAQSGSLFLCPTCSDDNVCNGIESCDQQAGACLSGTPLDCPADDDPCTADLCDPTAGCIHPLVVESPQCGSCTDCIDNDGDGYIDFEDPDCASFTSEQRFAVISTAVHAGAYPLYIGDNVLIESVPGTCGDAAAPLPGETSRAGACGSDVIVRPGGTMGILATQHVSPSQRGAYFGDALHRAWDISIRSAFVSNGGPEVIVTEPPFVGPGLCADDPMKLCTDNSDCGGAVPYCGGRMTLDDPNNPFVDRTGTAQSFKRCQSALASVLPDSLAAAALPGNVQGYSDGTKTLRTSGSHPLLTITLGPGVQVLYVRRISVGHHTELRLVGQQDTVAIIRVERSLRLGGEAKVTASGGLTPNHVLWNLEGKRRPLTLVRDSEFVGTVMAPERRLIRIGHGVHVSGALIVQKIQFHVDSVVSHYPFTALLP